MKKKILLFTVIVSALIFAFSLVANAESVKAESSSIDMKISFFDASYNVVEKTVKVDELFNVNFKNDTEEYYFKLTGVKSWDVDVNGTSYNIKKQLAGLYFPEGITHMPSVADGYWGFTGATVDHPRKVHLPESLVSLGGNFLRGIGYVSLVNEDDTNDNYLPSSLTEVNDHLFCYWTLCNSVIYFPEGFHNIGTAASTKWHLEGFKAASGSITMVFLGKMTFIDVDTYEKNFNPTFIFAKNKASDLWGYALPMVEGSTNTASTASYVNNTTDAQTLRLYWPSKDGTNSSMNTGKQTATIGSTAPRLVFCDGDRVEYVMTARFNTGSSYPALYDDNGVQLNAQGITGYGSSTWMRFYTTPVKYDMDAHETAGVHYNSIVYQPVNCGYDETTSTTCVVCKLEDVIIGDKATGNHTYTDDFNCETALDCEVCKKTLAEALTHTLDVSVAFDNGFTDGGNKSTACTNEGCNHKINEALDPVFVFTGVSTKISNSVAGITYGYRINKTSLNEYESQNGKLKHGMVIAFASLLGENEPIVNGEAARVEGCNIIMADASNGIFTEATFVLKGEKSLWENENVLVGGKMLKNAPLMLACYTVDTDGAISYFNYETGSSSDFVYTYSEIEIKD